MAGVVVAPWEANRRGRAAQRLPSSLKGSRIAFTVIVLFLLAQVTWWLIFQERYLSEVTRERLASWQRDAQAATGLLAAGADNTEIQALYPHLRLAGDEYVIDQTVRNDFLSSQRGYIRMFAFEVPFFVLVVLLGLYFIAATLRSERELKRRQQNFLSAVTHEFKTPISTLRLLIETALMRPLSAQKQREYLARMAGEVARLEQTSDQVLASARLEQAPDSQPLAPHDLGELVRTIVERLRQGLEARGAQLRLMLPGEPLPVSVDDDAFAMVLGNLLDNAVKYSPDTVKPVEVIVEEGGDLALVHVQDRGMGVQGGEEERIFDRFYRSGDEMTRETPGMGLGLHLAKRTVEAMNGWVRCSSRDDGPGTRFTVLLPRRQGAAGGAAAAREE